MSAKTGNIVRIPSVYVVNYCSECPMANVASAVTGDNRDRPVNVYCTALQKRVHDNLPWDLGFIHRAKEEDKRPENLDYIPDECPLVKDATQFGTLKIGEPCVSGH